MPDKINHTKASVDPFEWKGLFLLAIICLAGFLLQSKAAYSQDESHGRSVLEEILPKYRPLATTLAEATGMPPTRGNNFEIITVGERKHSLLLDDLLGAKSSILVEYYHFEKDDSSREIREILMKKASEGVRVRFINENIANFPIPPLYYSKMRKSGVEVEHFSQIRTPLKVISRINNRNHRKILVVDGKIGYTGGMNIADRYFFEWRDTHLRFSGDAVKDMQEVFLDTWEELGGRIAEERPLHLEPDTDSLDAPFQGKILQVVADGPHDGGRNIIQDSYEWTLRNAEEYFYCQTPYFAPPKSTLAALKDAARRGIDVRIMLPVEQDVPFIKEVNRAYYKECLEAGVRILERGEDFMHSKTFVSDDYLSSIGSANLDHRSFHKNYEDNIYIFDGETALVLRDIFLEDTEICHEVTIDEIKRWSWTRRLKHMLWRVVAFQL